MNQSVWDSQVFDLIQRPQMKGKNNGGYAQSSGRPTDASVGRATAQCSRAAIYTTKIGSTVLKKWKHNPIILYAQNCPTIVYEAL